MPLEYDWDVGGERGDQVIWFVDEAGQHRATLNADEHARNWTIPFGGSVVATGESSKEGGS